MSVVVPLKVLRAKKEFARMVASCPYDVVSVEEARLLAADKPLSFLHVEKSEIDVPPETPPDSNEIHLAARNNLQKLIQNGILVRENSPCFYIYRERMSSHEQYGIVAGLSIEAYEAGRIKKHEYTFPDKENTRTCHIDLVGAQTGPVFVTYRSHEGINRIVAAQKGGEPEYDFTAPDGVTHTVWRIDDEAMIRELTQAFAEVGTFYIADGHHRAAAAARVARARRESNPQHRDNEPYNYFLSVLIPHDQIRILDYNRVVRDLYGLDEAGFLRRLDETLAVRENFPEKSPRRAGEFGMYLKGRWYGITLKEGTTPVNDPVKSLDVSILQDYLLGPVLGIRDPRADHRIEFVGGIRGTEELERLVDSGLFAVAFSLYPTTLQQLMAVADSGRVMPPKSTWFEPKLASGLFVHLLND